VARTTPVRKAWRSVIWLIVIVVGLIGLNVFNFLTIPQAKGTSQFATFAPKLGLDLAGGTEIILEPLHAKGQTVTDEQLTQAVTIIRERIDAAGVAEPEISTQGTGGSENIVVQIPSRLDKTTQQRITKAAKLSFRPVLVTDAATTASASPSASAGASATPSPSLNTIPTSKPTNASDLAYVTPALQAEYDNFDCSKDVTDTNLEPANKPLVTCDTDGVDKYILGPVELNGTAISDAEAALTTTQTGASTGTWAVNITFKSGFASTFEKVESRLIQLDPPRSQFAIVLDGAVITDPVVEGVAAAPQITGNFT
jgi:preprotein translocase subunit SecD